MDYRMDITIIDCSTPLRSEQLNQYEALLRIVFF